MKIWSFIPAAIALVQRGPEIGLSSARSLAIALFGVLALSLILAAIWRFATQARVNRELRAMVDERNRAMEALRAQYRAIPIPTYTWSRAGTSAFILAACNDAADAVTDGIAHGLIGTTARDFFAEAPIVLDDIDKCFSTRRPDQREISYRFHGAAGVSSVIAYYAFVPPDQVMVHLQDITDRRETEAALRSTEEQFRQSQKLESIGRLAGGVAHDFNNLLTAMMGHTQLVLERLSDDSPIRSDLEEVRRGAERAAQLTRQLLAFSRRQVLQPKVIDLNVIVADLRIMLERLIGETIHVATDLAADLGHVRADPGQIGQVILNLVVNARDALPDGGVIRLNTRNARITVEEARSFPYRVDPGEYVILEVCDDGIGIAPDVLPQIFEPFFTTKDAGKGSGLGLSTVFGVVKQSGGYVWANSDHTGTTFRVYLPRVQDPLERRTAPPRVPVRAQAPETILLVDDEDAVRSLTVRILERGGYRVIATASGAEALDASENVNGDIDLLLTDVIMPEMNGREVARRIQLGRPGIKVLYTSGYTRTAVMERDLADDGVEFIEKPYEAQQLLAKVRSLLDASPAFNS
jgi:signal transduction histidine kinase/ActR/RegA family two-component response regulator